MWGLSHEQRRGSVSTYIFDEFLVTLGSKSPAKINSATHAVTTTKNCFQFPSPVTHSSVEKDIVSIETSTADHSRPSETFGLSQLKKLS